MKKFNFKLDDEIYSCFYELITLEKSLEIDYDSYKNFEFNSFYEMISIFKNLHINIYLGENKLFDSKKQDYENLNYKIIQKIYPEIKKDLNISNSEINEFLTNCKEFINSEKRLAPLPKELFIAKKIYNKDLSLSYSEIMKLSTKEYEKIHLALIMFSQAVGTQ